MSRARRAKKESNLWAIVLLLVCVFVVGGTFYMLYDINGKVKKINSADNTISNDINNDIDNEIINNQQVVQNIVNEANIVENTITNEIKNTTNTITNQVTNSSKKSNISDAPTIPAVTDDKQKAIELVKKEWGNDDSVSFSFDYINENGEYVVAVKDKSSATVKYYFRVNLETENVELD